MENKSPGDSVSALSQIMNHLAMEDRVTRSLFTLWSHVPVGNLIHDIYSSLIYLVRTPIASQFFDHGSFLLVLASHWSCLTINLLLCCNKILHQEWQCRWLVDEEIMMRTFSGARLIFIIFEEDLRIEAACLSARLSLCVSVDVCPCLFGSPFIGKYIDPFWMVEDSFHDSMMIRGRVWWLIMKWFSPQF